MTECVFCRIVSGEIPTKKLYEDDRTLAFLDIMPASEGHALVIPKGHYETLLDISKEELKKLIIAVREVAKGVIRSTNATGFNVLQSNKEIAGQVVPHVHFHIIPRYEGDGLHFHWPHKDVTDEELLSMQKRIKSAIQSISEGEVFGQK